MYYMKLFIILFILNFFVNVGAQISHGGKPFPYDPQKKQLARVVLPGIDKQAIILKSLSDDVSDGRKPLDFAWNHDVDFSPANSGIWTTWEGGIKTWRLEIVSPEAFAVNINFGKFRLRKNCMLFAYSPDQTDVLGGFNEKNNLASGELPLAFIPGEAVVIELQIPAGVDDFGDLQINSVAHDFINVFGKKSKADQYFGLSGDCNVDINCPVGLDWQIVKRSVCRYIFRKGTGTSLCTGTLINTTHYDNRPYLLTANHCISSATQAGSAVFYFDYESDTCNGADDTSVFTLSGSIVLSTSDSVDFTLLRLSSNVPITYNPYFAGWTRSELPATLAATVHHPQGDVKKISIENDPITASYQTINPPSWLFTESIANGFWRVRHWESGTTEEGSSGAPLFDQNKRIVGNLTGGDANCGNSINDYFSKLFMGWDYYPEPAKQLKYWLDSLNTGETYIPGSEPDPPIIVYAERYTLFPNPANDLLTFETDTLDISNAVISLYSVRGEYLARYNIREERRIIIDISFLSQGIYFFEFKNPNVTIRKKFLIIR